MASNRPTALWADDWVFCLTPAATVEAGSEDEVEAGSEDEVEEGLLSVDRSGGGGAIEKAHSPLPHIASATFAHLASGLMSVAGV